MCSNGRFTLNLSYYSLYSVGCQQPSLFVPDFIEQLSCSVIMNGATNQKFLDKVSLIGFKTKMVEELCRKK